jgi:hypothetical protein
MDLSKEELRKALGESVDELRKQRINPLTADQKFIIILISIFAAYSFFTIATVVSLIIQK